MASLRRRGFGIRQISRIVGYSAGWVCRLVKRLLSGQRRVFPEHHHHQPPPLQPPSWVTSYTWRFRMLALIQLQALQLRRCLAVSPPARDRSRYERGLRQCEKRVVAYLRRLEGVTQTIALDLSFRWQRLLADAPIEESTQVINRACGFGWGQRSGVPNPAHWEARQVPASRVARRTKRRSRRDPDAYVNSLFGWGQRC